MQKLIHAAQFTFLGLMILLLGISAVAQSNKGTVVGTVKDPQEALVTNAKITVVNSATGEKRDATTGDDGTYTVSNLEPGKYRVTAEAPGFQTVVFESVTVETNARLPLDVKFTTITGGAGTVTVTAQAAPLVESETSVRGDVITGKQVTDLPIPQRNFTLLAALSPGVTRPVTSSILGGGGQFSNDAPTGNSTESTRFRESGGSVISANGARATNNNFTLDGIDNNESQFGQIGIYPNPDAIAEFKVETSVPSAESGRAGGAIVSTTFKSGTNKVHGTIYEFYQGHFASARPTNNRNPPNYVTHNFGGTVGGPIFLPRFGEGGSSIWDGRNKSFFFFSYNGQRNGTPAFGGGEFNFVTVPTAKIRAGDFSELLQPANLVTYNTIRGPVVAPRGQIFDRNGNPYPGNIIPPGDLNQVASNVFNAYPLPTQSGFENNYRRNRSEKYNLNGYDIKIDHAITKKDTIFGRYSKQESLRIRDNNFPLGTSPNKNDLASGFGAGNEFGNSRQIALGDTHLFSPTLVNDARAGYTRVNIGIFNPGVGGALGFSSNNSANLGIPRTNNCGVVCSGTVLLGVTGTGAQPDLEFIGDGGPFYFTSNNFYFGDSLTVVKGDKTLKFGGDIRVRQNINLDAGRSGAAKGNWVFTTGAHIRNAAGGDESLNRNGFFGARDNVPLGPVDAGNGYANFLLGYAPTELSRGIPTGIPFLSSKEISFYVQDDWKFRPDLTLNLGLRYDVFSPQTERFDAQANFDPTSRQLIRTTKSSPFGRGGVKTDRNNFGPHLGFAYSGLRSNNKLILRGGYALMYSTDVSGQQPLSANFLGGGRYDRVPFNSPFLAGVNISTGSPVPVSTLPPDRATPGANQQVFFNDPHAKSEMYHQYNLTLQYEFRPNWLAEAGYVGSLGRNLLIVQNIGQGGGGARQIAGIDQVIETENIASSNYNSLQTKLERRFAKGLSILSSYTWAHGIDNAPGGFCIPGPDVNGCGLSNPVIGLSLDRGNADSDVRHRFTFANVYDLPLGRGRRFGSSMPAIADVFVGGWQFNNIITIQSGPVFSVFANGARVDLLGDPFSNLPPGRQLNRSAFRAAVTPIFASDPSGPKFGTLGRNVFRGQRQEYWDSSLFKNFPIRGISESFNAQVRIQAYNLLNHINHYRPNNNFNDTGSFGIDKANQKSRQLEFSLKLIF